MILNPYNTPTFKTNALCLISNEGQLKRLLLLYIRIIQPYLTDLCFGYNWECILPFFTSTYDTPTFKTEALHLVSNEGQVKHLSLLHIRINSYLSLLWLNLAMDFVTEVTTIDDIDSKSHTTELKSSHVYSTNHLTTKSRH